jgi:hypothetical protein
VKSVGDACRHRNAVADHAVAAHRLHCAVIDADREREAGGDGGHGALREPQRACGIREDHDGDAVGRLEHDAACRRQLCARHCHHGVELSPHARLLGDRPARELLDLEEDDAREDGGALILAHPRRMQLLRTFEKEQ